MQIIEFAPAKINLWLRVLGKLPDGYHQVETILQTISFADKLMLEPAAQGVSLTCDDARLPCNEHNLAYRAAALVASQVPGQGVHIYLEKRIPWRAGLGGGSSDAAAVLRGLNRLWRLNWSREQLLPLAQALGADVPFFLQGGTGIGRGRGDEIEILPLQPDLAIVLIQPPFGLSTPRVYSRWSPGPQPMWALPDVLRALEQSDHEALGHLLHNDLEGPAFTLAPQLAAVKRRLLLAGFPCLLSGSGACLFVVLPETAADQTHSWLQDIRRLLPPAYRAFLAKTRL